MASEHKPGGHKLWHAMYMARKLIEHKSPHWIKGKQQRFRFQSLPETNCESNCLSLSA
jgi:hypothetical protein